MKRNKRKRETSKTDMQSQCAADNKIVSQTNTDNCELRCRLRSQSGTLSKGKQPNEKLLSNKENFNSKSDNFLENSSDFTFCHATQSRSKENVDKNVPIQKRYAIDLPVKHKNCFLRNLILNSNHFLQSTSTNEKGCSTIEHN